jgi:syntaxin 6/SYP6 family syntaxin
MNKEYYSNFKQFLTDLTTKENNIRKDLEAFQTAIGNNENTIEIENRINKELKSLKDLTEQLTEAYSSKNAPPNMPEDTLDARQKDIKKFSTTYDELFKNLQKIRDDKYAFKGQITEDYRTKEEYQNMTAQELVHAGREKMNKQDERLDDITKDVKKGRVGIKEFDNQVKEQNKLIEQVNEDMDRVDSRMNKLSKRLADYIGKSNICYLIIFFLLDAVVFGLLVWVLTKIRRGFKWSS